VDQFAALVAQVQKNTSLIEKTIHVISRARLVQPDAPAGRSSSSGQKAAPHKGVQAAGRPATAGAAAGPAEASAASAQLAQGAGEGPAAAEPDVPDLQEFYEDFEQHRQQASCVYVVKGQAAGSKHGVHQGAEGAS